MFPAHQHRHRAQGDSLRQYSLVHHTTPHPLAEIPRDYRCVYPQGPSNAHPYRRSSSVSEQEWPFSSTHNFCQQSQVAWMTGLHLPGQEDQSSNLYASGMSCPENFEDSTCVDEACESSSCLRWRFATTLNHGLECTSPSRMDISRPSSRSLSSGPSSRGSTPPHDSVRCSSLGEWNHRVSSFPPVESSIPTVSELDPQYNMHLIAEVATKSKKMSIDCLLNPASPTSSTPPTMLHALPSQSSLQQRVLSEYDRLHESHYNHQYHHEQIQPSEQRATSPADFSRLPPPPPPPSTTRRRDPRDDRKRREKRAWDDAEIQLLLRCVTEAKHGGAKWQRVANLMDNGRSATSCANKFKRMKHNRGPASVSDCGKQFLSLSSSLEDAGSPSDETMDEEDDELEESEESSEGEEQ
ncbi:hypothetical protein BGZ59_010449 [Podila verticillata]|nr:hypothetical protein BGZ59_010449 [Podila verticillata]